MTEFDESVDENPSESSDDSTPIIEYSMTESDESVDETPSERSRIVFAALTPIRCLVVSNGIVEKQSRFYGGEFVTLRIWISRTVEIFSPDPADGGKYFRPFATLSSISFESPSRLTRIESQTFSCSSLGSILIPGSVEILGPRCFSQCQSLLSISFESPSRLIRIESEAFSFSSIESILIPGSVEILG
jgi:hypothetical protein